MEFVDTHCHIQSIGSDGGERTTSELWSKSELTAEEVINNATEANVTKLICVGCDLADSQLAVEFAKNRAQCYVSIGIHPHEAARYAGQKGLLDTFSGLVASPKMVAVGETGLDYFYNHSPKEAQIELLKFQIELALTHDLPIIFHVREAFDDFWPIFESYSGIRGVLHSFTDKKSNLERAIKHNLFIGVNGIATFAKATEQLDTYRAIPIENLLLETDAPFLTPTPYRGTINEPKHIRTVAKFLAALRGESLDKLAAATTANARKLFDL